MIYDHVVARDLPAADAERCSRILLGWAEGQAREVGQARGLTTQQIDAGAFADDERQHAWFRAAGFAHARNWWQMSRPVTPDEADLVDDPARWEADGVVFRLVDREGSNMPADDDLRAVHDVLESAFLDHFNSREETFAEFLHRLREDPATAGTTGGWPSSRATRAGSRRARSSAPWSRTPTAPTRRTSTTSGSSPAPAVAASRRACCAPSSPTRPGAAATASAWRSTRTPRPAPTGCTRRWAGSRSTAPSPGTATSGLTPAVPRRVGAVPAVAPSSRRQFPP